MCLFLQRGRGTSWAGRLVWALRDWPWSCMTSQTSVCSGVTTNASSNSSKCRTSTSMSASRYRHQVHTTTRGNSQGVMSNDKNHFEMKVYLEGTYFYYQRESMVVSKQSYQNHLSGFIYCNKLFSFSFLLYFIYLSEHLHSSVFKPIHFPQTTSHTPTVCNKMSSTLSFCWTAIIIMEQNILGFVVHFCRG